MMEVSRTEFLRMTVRYRDLLETLPPHIRSVLPETLSKFLSPANYSYFGHDIHYSELSITGERRWKLLLSPHARTLLIAHAQTNHPWK